MKKKLSLKLSINSPLPTKLSGECKKAAKILNAFIDPGEGLDKVIPSTILENAQGLAIFTVLKAGFLFSGRAGSGIVVARLPDGSWSAPSAIMTGGMGAGGQIGAELTDFVLILNTKEAVKTFSHFGNVTLGGNVSIAAGPVGRSAEASGTATLKHVSAIYSYSKTRGLFVGVSLEGSIVITRNDANEKLYGKPVTAKELLNGTIPPPMEADLLYRALNAKFHTLGSTASMYRRAVDPDSKSAVVRSTSISAPGTLRIPPVRRGDSPHVINHMDNSENNQYKPLAIQNPTQPLSPIPQKPNSAKPLNYPQNDHHLNNVNANTIKYNQTPPPLFEGQKIQFTREIKKSPPPTVSRMNDGLIKARVLYDFKGEQPGDLNLTEGDMIIITKKSDNQNDWWTGKLDGQQGAFPANYVELV
ncbi:hypothetical protein BDB01DRAFT_725627 [Pilobolus umbonatus]|nr:hypothetical protein BDB01DRAFT_725627 [Pilobolus umbonatus]